MKPDRKKMKIRRYPFTLPAFSVMLLLITLNFCAVPDKKPEINFEEVVQLCGDQLELLIQSADQLILGGDSLDRRGRLLVSPRNLEENGDLRLVPSPDWCSGFFPGCLWLMKELTGESKWEQEALRFTAPLEREKFNGGTHDMGFKMMCSFGNGLIMTGDPAYRDILIQSAQTLATRFNPKIGAIRSWDHNQDKWQYPVIIDNMMNLELLWWASEETGDTALAHIASQHALTTLADHFRADNSSVHVVDYDTLTGLPVQKHTHQGFSHESAWARGQAWGLYGYTMAYRKTGNETFLRQAEKIAEFILKHPKLPEDLIPLWDFDAPGPQEPRDVSAAAITASALYELAGHAPGKAGYYTKMADRILANLAAKYMSEKDGKHGFILDHSTGNKPAGSEIDVPIIYADYYFLEALKRYKEVKR